MNHHTHRCSTTAPLVVLVTVLLGIIGWLVLGSSEETSATRADAVVPASACNDWDDTSLAKNYSMRARSCGSVQGGQVVAEPQVQIDESWGDGMDSFTIRSEIRNATTGVVVATTSCDRTKEANEGTNNNLFSWDEEYLTCALTAPADGSATYEVKVDVEYDVDGDFGAGVQYARSAEAATVAAR